MLTAAAVVSGWSVVTDVAIESAGVAEGPAGAPAAPATTTTAAATTQPGTITTEAPPIAGDAVRRAKVGLSWFLLEHVDRPRNIGVPCPLLSSASLGFYVGQLGLTWSQLAYGVEVAWDTQVGDGLILVRCGVNMTAAADPAGSVSMQLQATMLDGQATFDQYAVRLGGRDVIVAAAPLGELAGRCSNGGRSCTYALHVDGLVITTQVNGLPAETGPTLTERLVQAVAPEVVTNLAAVAAPP